MRLRPLDRHLDDVLARTQVFDDWKAFAAAAARGAGEGGTVQEPRLSNVTLAFLEACCREEVPLPAPDVGHLFERTCLADGVIKQAHKLCRRAAEQGCRRRGLQHLEA